MILPPNHLGPNCLYCLRLQLHFYDHFNIHTDYGLHLLIRSFLSLLLFNNLFLPPSCLVSSHVFMPPFLMCIILGYTAIFKARSREKSVCITLSGPEVCTWLLRINSSFLICHQYFLFVKKKNIYYSKHNIKISPILRKINKSLGPSAMVIFLGSFSL